MTKKDIDTICWWIPFRKLRHAVRSFLNELTDNDIKREISALRREMLEQTMLSSNAQVKNKKVVYTCITNGYDNLCLHTYTDNSWDYVCFTDDKYLIDRGYFGNWKIKPIVFDKLDPVRNNRWHKLHPHIILPDYEESIYLDANIDVLSSHLFKRIIDIKEKNIHMSLSLHPRTIISNPSHNCIYKEYEMASRVHLEDSDILNKQLEIIKKDNMPENYGLSENNIIFRKHNESEIISIMIDWWYFVENYSKRDQLSLMYVLWKQNFNMPYLFGDNTAARILKDDFKYRNHKKARPLHLPE